MSRIDNLKQYEQMCNAYEARILELESELNHVQQEYDELSFKYQEAVSQIETSEKTHSIDAKPKDLKKIHNSYCATCIYIGKYIKKLRIESGLTQKELSEMVGIDIGLLQQYEQGVKLPETKKLYMIGKALNFPTVAILETLADFSENFFDQKNETHEEEENG